MSTPPSDPRQQYPNFQQRADGYERENPRFVIQWWTSDGRWIPALMAAVAVVAILGAVTYGWHTLFPPMLPVMPGMTTQQAIQDQQTGQNTASDLEKALNISRALNMYKTANGSYPLSLFDLIPRYLPNDDYLHTQTDPDSNASHISFNYTKPADNASPTTPLFSYISNMPPDISNAQSGAFMKLTFLINGQMTQDVTISGVDQNGKTSSLTMHSDGTGAPTMTVGTIPAYPSSTPTN